MFSDGRSLCANPGAPIANPMATRLTTARKNGRAIPTRKLFFPISIAVIIALPPFFRQVFSL
jgi:hypothetical protein